MQKFSKQYQIRATECDNNLDIRLSCLWDIMQDAAYHHANILGFDHQQMLQNGNFFVLVRMSANIRRYPKSQEKIKVETYPAGIHKLFCARKYEVFDEAGQSIADAVSLWILIDIATGRPLRPQKAYPNSPVTSIEYTDSLPEKIDPPQDARFIRQITAEFYDIDVNNHVNNARYINWIENALRPNSAPIKHINANYIQETKLAEPLDIYQKDDILIIKDKANNIRFACQCE